LLRETSKTEGLEMASGKLFDTWSAIVVILTVVLFVAALFVKGFTHDLFLEAGVLLVSIKLILMAQRNARTEENLERKLLRIEELLTARTASGIPMKGNEREAGIEPR
jgi:hypothetical protein